jgi:nitrogen fixation-related uncharacterized protein
MSPRRKSWSMLLLAVVILVPTGLGFANKFYEFIVLFRGDADGVFAITPIVNYLLAGFGFLLMFFWAAFNGMFHDIEHPKHLHLERERMLDRSRPPFPNPKS